MLLKFFKSNLPYVVIFIPILGVILWLPSLFPELSFKKIALPQAQTPFFNLLAQPFQSNYYLNIGSALVLCILQSFLLIRLNFKYIFIDKKTYLPAVIFILLGSSMFAFQNLHPALLANLALLFAFDRCFLIDKDRNLFKRYFEAGLFISIATLIYPVAIYFMIIIWLTQLLLRTFNWREWVSSLIGFITPIAFYSAILYLNSNFITQYQAYLNYFTLQVKSQQSFSIVSSITLIVFLVLFLFALLSSVRQIATKKISSRKYFNLFLWIILLTSLVFVLVPKASFDLVYFIASPVSIIFTIFFIDSKNKWLAELSFTILFVSIFILVWF